MFLERPMRRGRPARPLLPATRGSPSEGARSATHGAVSSRPGLLGQVLRSQAARAGGKGATQTLASRWWVWPRPPLPLPLGGRWAGPEGYGGGSGGTRPVKSSRWRPRDGRGLKGSPSSWCKRRTGRAVRCSLCLPVAHFETKHLTNAVC